MGEVVDHPVKKQRLAEVRFKLAGVIQSLGILEEMQDLPDDEKLELWQNACLQEIRFPGDGADVFKRYFHHKGKD